MAVVSESASEKLLFLVIDGTSHCLSKRTQPFSRKTLKWKDANKVTIKYLSKVIRNLFLEPPQNVSYIYIYYIYIYYIHTYIYIYIYIYIVFKSSILQPSQKTSQKWSISTSLAFHVMKMSSRKLNHYTKMLSRKMDIKWKWNMKQEKI